jgi:hypothetical protein
VYPCFCFGSSAHQPAGIFHKIPFTQQQWYEFALTPPDDGTLKFIFELGQADGTAWAKYTGRATQDSSTAAGSQQAAAGGRRLLKGGSDTAH